MANITITYAPISKTSNGNYTSNVTLSGDVFYDNANAIDLGNGLTADLLVNNANPAQGTLTFHASNIADLIASGTLPVTLPADVFDSGNLPKGVDANVTVNASSIPDTTTPPTGTTTPPTGTTTPPTGTTTPPDTTGTAPTPALTFDPVAVNDAISAAEKAAGVTLTGSVSTAVANVVLTFADGTTENATIANGKWSHPLTAADYTAGLSPISVIAEDASGNTLTISTDTNGNPVTELDANVTVEGAGVVSSTGGSLTYSANQLVEAVQNDGSISEKITLTLSGDTFYTGDATAADSVIGKDLNLDPNLLGAVSGDVPAGLTAHLMVIDATTAELTLTGKATHNEATDDTSIAIALPATYFASDIAPTDADKDIAINFMDASALAVDGSLTESPKNDGTINGVVDFNVMNDTFKHAVGDDVSSLVDPKTVPTGYAAHLVMMSTTQAQLTLTVTDAVAAKATPAGMDTIQVAFTAADFTSGNLPAGDLPVADVTFITPSLIWSDKATINDPEQNGFNNQSITLTLTDATFVRSDLDLTRFVKNVPAGVTVSLKTISDTDAELTVTGGTVNNIAQTLSINLPRVAFSNRMDVANASSTVNLQHIDNIAPNAPVIDPIGANNVISDQAHTAGVTITGTAEANSTITLSFGTNGTAVSMKQGLTTGPTTKVVVDPAALTQANTDLKDARQTLTDDQTALAVAQDPAQNGINDAKTAATDGITSAQADLDAANQTLKDDTTTLADDTATLTADQAALKATPTDKTALATVASDQKTITSDQAIITADTKAIADAKTALADAQDPAKNGINDAQAAADAGIKDAQAIVATDLTAEQAAEAAVIAAGGTVTPLPTTTPPVTTPPVTTPPVTTPPVTTPPVTTPPVTTPPVTTPTTPSAITNVIDSVTVKVGADGKWHYLMTATDYITQHGVELVSATATDATGNISKATTVSVTLPDTTPPTAATVAVSVGSATVINQVAEAAGLTAVASIAGTGAVVGDSVQLLENGKAFTTPMTHVLTAADITAGKVSFAIPTKTLGADGSIALTSTVTDIAGNVGAASPATTLTLDTTAPTAATAAVSVGTTNVINKAAEAAGLTAVASIVGTGAVVGDSVQLLEGGKAFTTPMTHMLTAADITAGKVSFAIPTKTLGADGTIVLTSVVTDVAGNVGVASAATTLTLDTVAPTALGAPVVITGADSLINKVEAAAAITIESSLNGTGAVVGDVASLFVDGKSVATVTLTDAILKAPADVVDFIVPAGTLTVDGNKVLTAQLTDVAGNMGAVSANTTITLDTTVATPVVTVKADNVTLDISAWHETGAEVDLSIDAGKTFAPTTTDILPSGTYAIGQVQLKQVDIAGNVSAIGSNTAVISGSTIVAVTAANTTAYDASQGNVGFNVTTGNYTYNIANFTKGDAIDFAAGNTPTVANTNFADGNVDLQYAAGGMLTTLHLTGLTPAQDAAAYSVNGFNTLFGANAVTATGLGVKISGATAPVVPTPTPTPVVPTGSSAVTGAGTEDGSKGGIQFNITPGNYVHTITGFVKGDVLHFPVGNTPAVSNSNFTDGTVEVDYASNGTLTQIMLTGLPAATDSAIYSVGSFNTVFGAGSILVA